MVENRKVARQLEKAKEQVHAKNVGEGEPPSQWSGSSAQLVREGVRLAAAAFRSRLAVYRGRYDRVRGTLDACRSNCGILRRRIEELADFLQQLLNSWDANETLNLSSLRQAVSQNLHT